MLLAIACLKDVSELTEYAKEEVTRE